MLHAVEPIIIQPSPVDSTSTSNQGKPAAPAAEAACHVKSLVFLADSSPVVAVLNLVQRVDRRKLAAALGLAPSKLTLAPAEQLPQLCGYPAGSVPPLGHKPRLPVIIDSAVAQQQHCLVGGQQDGAILCLLVPDVLRVTGATVASITSSSSSCNSYTGTGISFRGTGSDGGSAAALPSAGEAASRADSSSWAQGDSSLVGGQLVKDPAEGLLRELPLPWKAGSTVVTLEGIVAQRRKIARLLLFANLVPMPAEGAAAPAKASGSSTYLRRLWCCPEGEGSGRPCEVQLILGKTLADGLGRETAADLLRSLRVGQRVRVVGRPQPHAQPPHGTRRPDVLDVVVAELEVLAEPPPSTPACQAEAVAAAGIAAPAASTPPGSGKAGALPFLKLPPALQGQVSIIDDEAGLGLLSQTLFRYPSLTEEVPPTSPSESASTALPAYRAVVGLDCEWQPYRRGEQHTPVALLQLAVQQQCTEGSGNAIELVGQSGQQGATWQPQPQQQQQQQQQAEQHVFLLDMLALCSRSTVDIDAAAHNGIADTQGDGSSSDGSKAEQAPPAAMESAQELSPTEQVLSSLLQRLFEDAGVVKIGFAFSHDLRRLCESYSHLPCFASRGRVPLSCYVDVLRFAHAVMPTVPKRALPGRGGKGRRATVGLSTLTEAVLRRQLDKAEQCSNWAARPLSAAQQAYAATDAYCLVALFEELLRRQQRKPAQGGMLPLTPAWFDQMAGGMTDVTAVTSHSAGRPPAEMLLQHGSSHTPTGSNPTAGRASARQSGAGAGISAARPVSERSSSRNSGTLRAHCNVEYLLQQYLGQSLPQGGKAAAVRAGAADGGGQEPKRTLRKAVVFPRGGGVLEWSNAFMLFVNIHPRPSSASTTGPGPAARYDNRFLWGLQGQLGVAEPAAAYHQGKQQEQDQQRYRAGDALYITWWPGRGQTLEHPVMQRMLGHPAPGFCAAVSASTSGSSPAAAAGWGVLAALHGMEGRGPAWETPPASKQPGPALGGSPSTAWEDEAQGHEQQQQQQQQQQGLQISNRAEVLLFCRPAAGPYVFCGRLGKASAVACLGSNQGDGGAASCIVWQLLDWPRLQGQPAFEHLLSLQGGQQ
ncbi:hypothetical protein N2152v2_004477 [Parachlorella kessleri]